MKQEIKEKYEELARKYNLPSFNILDNEFEISTIGEKEFLLREIRRKIVEKIEEYIKLLEGVLYPETNLCDTYECIIFSDEEKNGIFGLYKKLMFINRFSIETSIGEDDKKSSEFIKEAWKQWDGAKKEFLSYVKKIKESWLKEIKVKTELGYLG
jgi:hypothetical protein